MLDDEKKAMLVVRLKQLKPDVDGRVDIIHDHPLDQRLLSMKLATLGDGVEEAYLNAEVMTWLNGEGDIPKSIRIEEEGPAPYQIKGEQYGTEIMKLLKQGVPYNELHGELGESAAYFEKCIIYMLKHHYIAITGIKPTMAGKRHYPDDTQD